MVGRRQALEDLTVTKAGGLRDQTRMMVQEVPALPRKYGIFPLLPLERQFALAG